MGCYWELISPTITLLATALAVFQYFCAPAQVLGSLSLLCDAWHRRDLEPWLGGNGLVGDWVGSGCVLYRAAPRLLVGAC